MILAAAVIVAAAVVWAALHSLDAESIPGMASLSFCPAKLREVTRTRSTWGWRSSSWVAVAPAYPLAPMTATDFLSAIA